MEAQRDSLFIVEDDADMASTLRQQLEEQGFNVLGSSRSGEDAIDQVGLLQPDLVLMDINLAGAIDGIETAQILRERFQTAVIFLTGLADQATLERAKSVDPYGYIMKPSSAEEIHVITDVAIHRHRVQQLLDARAQQQAAMVDLSLHALLSPSLDELSRVIATRVSQVLAMDFVGVFDCLGNGQLRRRPAIGWGNQRHTVSAPDYFWRDSKSARAHAPIVLGYLRSECDEGYGQALRDAGITSGMCAIIADAQTRYGYLFAYSRTQRFFSHDDQAFLQSIANVLSQAFQYQSASENVRRLAAIVESCDDAIIGASLDGDILCWNAGAERTLGFSAKEAAGRRMDFLFPPESVAEARADFERTRSGERLPPRETFSLRKDGSAIPISLAMSAVRDETGKMLSVSVIARDISDSRLVRQLELQTKALERSNRDLQQFAFMASHDLQEPLRMVSMNLDLLRRRLPIEDASLRKHLTFAMDGAARMRELVGSVLTYSPQRNGVEGEARIELDAVVDSVLKLLAEARERAHATIRVEHLPAVQVHPTLIAQVFQNLIENAMKYRSDADPRIEITAQTGKGEWIVSVADNGLGVKAESRESIFHLFHRLPSDGNVPGSGIGLAICKSIVERHGGRIWVEEREGGGSIFRFSLPDAEAHA